MIKTPFSHDSVICMICMVIFSGATFQHQQTTEENVSQTYRVYRAGVCEPCVVHGLHVGGAGAIEEGFSGCRAFVPTAGHWYSGDLRRRNKKLNIHTPV